MKPLTDHSRPNPKCEGLPESRSSARDTPSHNCLHIKDGSNVSDEVSCSTTRSIGAS